MEVTLLAITPDAEKLIERAARTCYKSEMGNTGIIQTLIKKGHESVLEHACATFKIEEVSRSLTHQLVRHRIASPSQQSQRYVSAENFQYVFPDSIKNNKEAKYIFMKSMESIREAYKELRDLDIPKEDARYVLPNACHTEIVFTINFRSMRNLLHLRLDKHAQWEIRYLAGKMLELVRPFAQNVFFDFAVIQEK